MGAGALAEEGRGLGGGDFGAGARSSILEHMMRGAGPAAGRGGAGAGARGGFGHAAYDRGNIGHYWADDGEDYEPQTQTVIMEDEFGNR